MHGADGAQQVVHVHGFQEIAIRPRLEQGKDIRIVIIGGKDEDADLGEARLDLPSGLPRATQTGHLHVQQSHIGS